MNKIKRIKYLIEQLDVEEIKELNILLEIPFSKGSEYPQEKTLEDFTVEEIANKILNKEIKETPKILMIKDDNDWSVAHELANNSDKTLWYTQIRKILMSKDVDGTSVAHLLAQFHPTWEPVKGNDLLDLEDASGTTVEELLANRETDKLFNVG